MPKFKIGDYVQDKDARQYRPLFGTICRRSREALKGDCTYMVDAENSHPYWVSAASALPARGTLSTSPDVLVHAEKPIVQQAADAATYYDAITS